MSSISNILKSILQGSETSAITVCFCLLMLAIHQDIQVSDHDRFIHLNILYSFIIMRIIRNQFKNVRPYRHKYRVLDLK